ncbi:MAG: diacylglycerol kinase family protein [Saprospiraceae bacterium]|nr:diacylglycerol kinase family protein [Saprospiraceae bacterium]MDZ4702460.1 diacylglycerol kinase family protein [Saprospiraceae bacterium]
MSNYFINRIRSFRYAFNGLAELVGNEPNMRIHLVAMCVVLFAGAWFAITPAEWVMIVLSIVIVIGGEAMNTAIEHLADVVSPGFHPLVKKAKDVAAAAVFLLALGAALVGTIIFLPRIIALF